MKVKPLICPRCGGDLVATERRSTFRCPSCGMSVVVDFSPGNEQTEPERRAEIDRERELREAYTEARKMELEHETQKERSANRFALGLILFLFGAGALLAVSQFVPGILARLNGEIRPPVVSEAASGIAYRDIAQRFEDAGFTDIEAVGLEDLGLVEGFFHDPGDTDHVTINGNEGYGEQEYFAPDSPVKIYYHSEPR